MPNSTGAELLALTIVHTLWQGFLLFGVLRILLFVGAFRQPAIRYEIYRYGLLGLIACPMVTLMGLTLLPEQDVRRSLAIPQQRTSVPFFPNIISDEPSARNSLPVVGSVQKGNDTSLGDPSSMKSVNSLKNSSTAGQQIIRQQRSTSREEDRPLQHLDKALLPLKTISGQPLWMSILSLLWVVGFAVMTLRLVLGTGGLRRLRRTARAAPNEWELIHKRLCGQLGVSTNRSIAIGLSDHIHSPLIMGLFRPLILLPASWVTALSPQSLEALLLHELAHWQRGDLWMIWLQRGAETVLFFHPVTWWFSRRLTRERELCCDDVVIGLTEKPLLYAQVLEFAAMASRQADRPQLVLALGGTPMELLHRVKRVLGITTEEGRNHQGLAGAAIFACSLSAAVALFWVPGAILSTSVTPAFGDDEPRPPERGERPGPPPPRNPEEGDRPRPPYEENRDRPRPPYDREGRGPEFDGPRGGRPAPRGLEEGPPPPHVVMRELMHAVRELRAEISALRAEVRELRGSGHGPEGRPPHRPDDRHPPRDGDRPPRGDDFRPRDGSRPPRGPHEADRPGRPPHPEDRDRQHEARGPQKDGPDKPKPPEDKPQPPAKPDEA